MVEGAALSVGTAGEREVLLGFLADHRHLIRETVLTLTDQESRQRLVPSLMTPMGLLKHATFVEAVVLNHCIRELAQHAGHAEILVEQIVAQRS